MCPNDLIPEGNLGPVGTGRQIAAAAEAIKVIVCDLDGTLLDSRKMISSANLAAIKAAVERGIFVTICTGRIPEMMEAYSRLLGIKGLLIAANGAVIVDTRDNSMPYRICVDGEDAGVLLEFCAQRGFDHVAAALEGCYYSEGSNRIKRFEQYNKIAGEENLRQIPLFPFNSYYSAVAGMRIYKILISGLSAEEQRQTECYIGTLSRLGFTSSEPQLLDVIAAGVDKGTGVQNLARIMGISEKEICVFGDYYNDIPMFKAAGLSVAMGNSDDEVKSKATVVTGTNDENGVALAIGKYFLGR